MRRADKRQFRAYLFFDFQPYPVLFGTVEFISVVDEEFERVRIALSPAGGERKIPAAKTNISKSTTAFLKIFIKIPPVNLSPSR